MLSPIENGRQIRVGNVSRIDCACGTIDFGCLFYEDAQRKASGFHGFITFLFTGFNSDEVV